MIILIFNLLDSDSITPKSAPESSSNSSAGIIAIIVVTIAAICGIVAGIYVLYRNGKLNFILANRSMLSSSQSSSSIISHAPPRPDSTVNICDINETIGRIEQLSQQQQLTNRATNNELSNN